MDNHHDRFDYPGNQKSSAFPWIVAAVLGAMLMLVTGMFAMFVLMNLSKTPSDETVQPETARPETARQASPPAVADSAATEGNQLTQRLDKTSRSSEQMESLPDLPNTTEIQKHVSAKDGSTLAYEFGEESLVYGFTMTLKPRGEREVRLSGRTSYKPIDVAPEELVKDGANGESTGTGFMVHPQGMIVTCAHVVNQTNSVEITIGDEIHQATVICTDDENDLALLRIDAKNSPYLSIAESMDVEQGESIRVFGFPLTTQLGGSMKISSGTVTGFSDENREVQIDATVNPGNSGGPVVDENGTVVGVASELLAAGGISSVGLAVNVEKIRQFLRRHKIPFSSSNKRKSKQQIRDAVVFIRNQGGAADVSSAKSFAYSSFYSGDSRTNDKGKIVFDDRGNLANPDENQKSLPLIFQRLCQVGIEELPRSIKRPWTVSNPISIERTKTEKRERQNNPFGLPGIGPRFGPRHFGGFHDPFGRGARSEVVKEKTVTILANETRKISLESDNSIATVFRKVYKIATIQSPDKTFDINMKYDGEFKFDKKNRRLSDGKFNGDAVLSIDGEPTRLPFSFSYQLIPRAKLEKEKADRQAKVRAMKERQDQIEAITTNKFDLYDPEK